MPSTLAQLEARVAVLLSDAGYAVFSTATIDEGLRQALADYSQAVPLARETVLTLPGDGREIALNNVTGLLQVTDVWWPFNSTAAEVWPPNRVRGFRLWWDDGAAVLFLTAEDGGQPRKNDELRVWYTTAHTIQNLDAASATTPLVVHESMLCRGAAGFCCLTRSTDLNETAANMAVSTPNYAALADLFLEGDPQFQRLGFYPWLDSLKNQMQVRGEPYGAGWVLDKWDAQGASIG